MTLPQLDANRQIGFALALDAIRGKHLGPALSAAVAAVGVLAIDKELAASVDHAKLTKLAVAGVRGEAFFPVPSLLAADPNLLGYYRLLYGQSQKSFYRAGQFSTFQNMELRGTLNAAAQAGLNDLCKALIYTGELLVDGLATPSLATVHELQLMTFGPQLKGGENNVLGTAAIANIKQALETMLKAHVTVTTPKSIALVNAAGEKIEIKMASDPDLLVTNLTKRQQLLAIEVKGGTDAANRLNRLGEAEKSHLKMRGKSATIELWTLVMIPYTTAEIKANTPHTQLHFHMLDMQDTTKPDYASFRQDIARILGIPTPP